MNRFSASFWQAIKGGLVQFASIIPGWAAFRLVGTFVYHSMPTWLPGSLVVFAIAAALWIWCCLNSEWPVLRTLGTLLISSVLWFFFLLALFRGLFIFDHHELATTSDVIVLLVSIALVVYLRRVLIRRNKDAERWSLADAR